MKHFLTITILLLFSCDLFDENESNTKTLQKNIAIVTNQGSGYLTVIDLTTQTILDEINLSEKLQAFADKGGVIPDLLYIQQPRPHYVQTSFDGKYVYIIHTNKQGAIIKLDAEFNVLAFETIKNTTYPAHMQLTKDNKEIYISTWTTNSSSNLDEQNFVIKLDAQNLKELDRIKTPAGSHGIKLTPSENRVIVGHDLIDFVSIIQGSSNKKMAIRAGASENSYDSGDILSPTQLAISPDEKFAFFSCKVASKIMVFDLIQEDTIGFFDLKKEFNLEESLSPYSLEVGPKENYSSADNKFLVLNFKGAKRIARLLINPNGLTAQTILSADTTMIFSDGDQPHGLDITDDGKIAVVSAQGSASVQAKTYIIDLENWKITKEFDTKIHSRGLCIYPSTGN